MKHPKASFNFSCKAWFGGWGRRIIFVGEDIPFFQFWETSSNLLRVCVSI